MKLVVLASPGMLVKWRVPWRAPPFILPSTFFIAINYDSGVVYTKHKGGRWSYLTNGSEGPAIPEEVMLLSRKLRELNRK